MSVDGAPPSPEAQVEEAGRRARIASRTVAGLPTGVKNDALNDIADAILAEGDRILQANELDVRAAERRRLPDSLIDHLILTWPRLGYIAEGVRAVAALTDPVGEVLRGSRRPNGLITYEVRVPLGVVGMVYEARPNLTVDAVSLCLKAGNAVLLLGGEDAARSNRALLGAIKKATVRQGIPDDAIQLIDLEQEAAIDRLMRLRDTVDVLIPRGSPEQVRRIRENATVPMLEVGMPGNCHIFVERTARLSLAADIAFNAKVQRPGAGNSMETLLVDRPIAAEFLPIVGPRMQAAGVELRGCDLTRTYLPELRPATDDDWAEAYQGLTLAVRVVDGLDHAVAHIARYGRHHSEAIITQDYLAGKRFIERVDAAAVYINASTRFTDGFEFGLGAELGISTQKLHRRGPIGLRALTTWKWIVQGEGQVRD